MVSYMVGRVSMRFLILLYSIYSIYQVLFYIHFNGMIGYNHINIHMTN